MKKSVLTFSLLCAGMYAVRAQSIGPSVINATGGSSVIGGSTFEYAVGDVVAGNTLTSSTLVVTPGVLQPKTASTGVGRVIAGITGLQVYPSPVASTLYLQPDMGKRGTLQYALYDAAGKLVLNQSAVLDKGNERQEANVQALAAGQYSLIVTWLEGSGTFRSVYKIQKLK